MMDLSLPIDTIEKPSADFFMEAYFKPQKPVIIKGLTEHTAAQTKWNFEYMKQKLGNTQVGVFDNARTKNSTYVSGDTTMLFADFIEIIQRDEPCNYRLFLFNAFKHAPELRTDFPCPEIFRGFIGDIGLMFFGGKDTGVRMHYDVDMSNVLHTQFMGKKRVLLIAPEYSDLLYQPPFTAFSLVNFANPDYDKFPALRKVKGYEFVLEHGDSLFMPSGYWHYMTYLEGGFAVTYRKIAAGISGKYQGVMNLTLNLLVDKMMNRLSRSKWDRLREHLAYRKATMAAEQLP